MNKPDYRLHWIKFSRAMYIFYRQYTILHEEKIAVILPYNVNKSVHIHLKIQRKYS